MTAAVAALEHATSARDGSIQGQVKAIERMLASGSNFSGKDLSGIALTGATLANGDFSRGSLHFANLDSVRAAGANFSSSGLRFADLSGSDFSNAVLSDVYAPFLLTKSPVRFAHARIERANLVGAQLSGADFTGADLRGTSFAFADLRKAIFDGADLEDTQFVGAVLDGSSFKGAKVADTNMIGASVVNVTFSAQQISAMCRSSLSLIQGQLGVWLSVTEQASDSSIRGGTRYETLFDSRIYVDGFTDRSLRICPPVHNEAVGYDVSYPYEISFGLRQDYLNKAGRRKILSDRIKQFSSLLESALSSRNLIRGPDIQAVEWAREMRARSVAVDSVRPPYLTTDQLRLLLLKHGIIAAEDLNWTEISKAQIYSETQLLAQKAEAPEQLSAWPIFFPKGVPFEELPADASDLFRSWSVSRANQVADIIVLRPASHIVRKDTAGQVYASFNTGYLRPTFEEMTTSNSWPSSTTAQRLDSALGNLDRAIFAPVRYDSFGRSVGRILLVFPKPYKSYRTSKFLESLTTDREVNPPLDLYLAIDKIERFDYDKSTVLIHVHVDRAYLNLGNGEKLTLSILSE